MNENEQSTRHDIIQHDLVSNKDHVSDIGIASLERSVAPHCRLKHVYSREGDSVSLTSNIIEPCEQKFDVIHDKETADNNLYYRNMEKVNSKAAVEYDTGSYIMM